MKIFNQIRRKARVVADVLDYNLLVDAETAQLRKVRGDEDLPIHYVVKVQIKIALIWVTIWGECCDFSDGDSREHINQRANNLYKILEGKENG